jgi:hypothetical protein
VAASFAAVALVALTACSDDEPDQVVVDEGRVPDEATTTSGVPTTAPPSTAPPTDLGPPTLTDSSPVSTAGIGDVEFGMSVAEAEEAAGSPLVPVDPEDAEGCYVAAFEDGPIGLQLTISNDTVERLDVVDGPVSTLSGAGIGDTAAQLRELFGDQLVPGADPDGEGEVLTFVPEDEGDAGTRIIFVMTGGTDAGEVAELRAGTRPIVDSGC